MYNIKLYDYVPKPEPATGDRIIAAHYYPSWTKGENGLTKEFCDIFNFPERTPLMGYYQDNNPEVIDWEIKWALEHGINCFIYCWYRKKENEGKPITVDSLRLAKGLHEGFFGARYQNMINFAVMFETQGRWGACDSQDLMDNVLPFWFENYFCRENYLKIDNKPVVFLYDTGYQLRDMLGGDSGMKEALNKCREIAIQKGFNGLIFCSEIIDSDQDKMAAAKARGVDAVFQYNWNLNSFNPNSNTVYEKQMDFNIEYLNNDSAAFIPTVSNFFDPEPRYTTLPEIPYGPNYWYTDFKTYRKLLRDIKNITDRLPKNNLSRKIIMVDNFNEWDEGHFLLPSYRFGFKYLQAIREELTNRNNLPDYRTPESLGFKPYDTAWNDGSLDLSKYNTKRLDNGEFSLIREWDK